MSASPRRRGSQDHREQVVGRAAAAARSGAGRTPRTTSGRATGVGTTDAASGRGRPGTIVGGDAVARNVARRPAHRHDAQPHRSIISADGPMPDTFASGDERRRPRVGPTPTAVTHPADPRPCSGTRTIVPTASGSDAAR